MKLEPTLARPKGISGTYLGRMINGLAGGRVKTFPSDARVSDPEIGSAPGVSTAGSENIAKTISDQTVSKIGDALVDKYEDFYNQLVLPGFEKGEEEDSTELDTLPLVDMEFFPRADKIVLLGPTGEKVKFSTKEVGKGAAGINIIFPYNFIISLTNQQYWDSIGDDEGETAALIEFLKWIDDDEVRDQIQALLQASLNDAALNYMKEYPQQSVQDLEKKGVATHWADVGPEEEEEEPEEEEPEEEEEEESQIPGAFNEPQVAEQQLQELYKRWAKMIR